MGITDVLQTKLGDLNWTRLDERSSSGDSNGFCRALSVWVLKPHVINRRLAGAQIVRTAQTECRLDSAELPAVLSEFLCKHEQRCVDTVGIHAETDGFCPITEHVKHGAAHDSDHQHGSHESDTEHCTQSVDLENLDNIDDTATVIILRDLHPKQPDRYLILRELIIFDKLQQTALFCPISKRSWQTDHCGAGEVTEVSQNENESSVAGELTYRVVFRKGSEECPNWISMDYCQNDQSASSNKPQSQVTPEWLKDVLLVKFCRWAEEEGLRTGVTSLKLVPVDRYTVRYQQLKQKYGTDLVKNWPESTDPQKFVYEDIAIATYLLHPGLGVDVRKRKIWDMFGPSVNLQETSITPSACSLFPQYDWLIGNHSDELTPWIPVIAARSSYTCSYFLLPCCLHDFDRKFSQKESGRSQYRTYLDYILQVGQVCGFEVREDTLRIPSTKRVCFVGNGRTYPQSAEAEADEKRSQFIAQRCQKPTLKNVNHSNEPSSSSGCDIGPETKRGRLDLPAARLGDPASGAVVEDESKPQSDAWASQFQPRSKKERTRNCRDVDKATKEDIVTRVFEKVLMAETGEEKVTADGRTWRKGGSVPLPEVAAMFDREVLQQLKCECGGIQTLLRNHHYIFEVSGGCVKLRDTSIPRPPKKSSKKKSSKGNAKDYNKTFHCWFYTHHPDGCPGTDLTCTYAHGVEQLRDRPKDNTS